MAILYRGIIGSQYVYSVNTPPTGASNISIVSNIGSGAPSDRGIYNKVTDLPNVKSSSTNLDALGVGDYATVVSSNLFTNETYFCTDNSRTCFTW